MPSQPRLTLHYVLAVLLLAGAGTVLQVARNRGALQLIKQASPIRKPIQDLDRSCVLPSKVQASRRLASETVEELGTEEYIDWALDTSPARVPWKSANLSVTYYTGVQDQVPHVPEECMHQAAYLFDSEATLEADMKELGRRVDIHRLSFYPPRRTGEKTYVYYTICVNGDFYTDRQRVRLRMGDPRESHLYYSKVELTIEGLNEDNLAVADQRAFSILDRVLVELVKSHWPERGTENGGLPDAAKDKQNTDQVTQASAGRVTPQ